MDSRDCTRNKYLGAIKEKIENGELTFEEICERLKAEVNAELGKPRSKIDYSFISSCQSLLDSLSNSIPYVSKQPQYEQELIERIKKSEQSRSLRKRALSTAAAAVAVLLLFVFGDTLLRREWLEGDSSIDMQQYEIAGHVVDPGLVESGIAGHSTETQEVTTQIMEEAVDVLGFTPLVPTWYPDGWVNQSYYAVRSEGFQWYFEALESTTEKNFIKYEVRRYDDVDEASAAFEQNNHGRALWCNGWDVYITENIDELIVVWLDGNRCYALHGPLEEEELLEIVKSIDKGD